MIGAIGALLTLGGFSALVIGLIRYFFPSTEKFIPDDLKKAFSIRNSVIVGLIGLLVLLYF